jgi:hypothetical protein
MRQAIVFGLQLGLRQEIGYCPIDLIKGCLLNRRSSDQQDVPASRNGVQSPANAVSHNSLDPVSGDGSAKSTTDRKRKTALLASGGTFYQDTPTVATGLPMFLQVLDLCAACQPVLLSKHLSPE